MADEELERPRKHGSDSHITLSFDRATLSLLRDLVAGFIDNARQLNRIERHLGVVLKNEESIMANIAELEAAVAEGTTVQQSAITLLTQLSDMVKAAGTDPVKLAAVVEQLTTNRAALAAAIVANTPAAEEPPPAPEGRNR